MIEGRWVAIREVDFPSFDRLTGGQPLWLRVWEAIYEIQGAGNNYVSDAQVADRLALPLIDVRGYMERLQQEGKAKSANSHSGYACGLSPAQRLEYQETIQEVISQMKNKSSDKSEGSAVMGQKIFIGHGHSPEWLKLAQFLSDRLHLPYVEFSSEPGAGYSNKERLEQMLDSSCFAFILMTAEDKVSDGATRARENVVHEAGLFQGRLGFTRAIILLEEGCTEFSNIEGLIQIRFPAGDISARFEKVRAVLEREGII